MKCESQPFGVIFVFPIRNVGHVWDPRKADDQSDLVTHQSDVSPTVTLTSDYSAPFASTSRAANMLNEVDESG